MALQGFTVEVAFTTTPFADPSTLTWTDVTAKVLPDMGPVSIRRGRQYEQTQMAAGTLSFLLDNRTGEFDPDNASGSHYPLVVPEVPVRIKTTFAATSYTLFFGFIESWVQTWDAAMFSRCLVTAVDGLDTVLAYNIGLGYTERLVSDYGGTIGTQDDFVWPWQAPNTLNSYLNAASANVVPVGTSSVTGIAQTGLQLSGSGSSFYWTPASIGARGYWAALDGWFRVDTMPGSGSVPKCMVFNGSSNGSNITPNLGFGPLAPATGIPTASDSLSMWLINYPLNRMAAAVADPTVTTSWATTLGTLAVATITTSNGLQRIYLDNGATDFYGATKALRLTTTGAGPASLTSPFTAIAASTTYTFGVTLTQEQTAGSGGTLFVDWYNGAALLSSTALIGALGTAPFLSQITQAATSPASTTQFKLRWAANAAAGTSNWDMSQMFCVLGTFNNLIWYAGGTTPAQSLLFIVAAGTGVHPPSQSSSATGWPCYGTVAAPAAGTWFHAAVDAGMDNVGTAYATVALRMPSTWFDGASVRMWTTGPPPTPGFNAQPWGALGVQVYFTGGGTPIINSATAIAMTVDELYIPDANIATSGEVTAAKAAAHYSYGLGRHDYVQQLTGARVGAVLDSVGWPTVQRSVDAGTLQIQAQTPDTTGTSLTGVGLIQNANTVEGGLFFVARDGKFAFWDQAHTMGGSPVITIGDGAGEIPYLSGPQVSKDKQYIYNLVTLTKNITDGSSTAYVTVASDATSQGQYKVKSYSLSAPWATNTDMDALAASIIADYKNPATRIASVSVDGVQTAAFASLLGREIGDYLAVKIRPRSAGPTITVNAYLQGMSLTITATSWLWTFNLSPTIAGH